VLDRFEWASARRGEHPRGLRVALVGLNLERAGDLSRRC
jgi:hypothetical protein